VAAPKHPDQTNGQAHDINSSRKRRLSKRERKNLKKRKTPVDEIVHVDEASLHDNGHEKPTTCSYTLEQYMANYTPAPITKHLSKQQGDSSSSLGKWFPKATVIKSSVCYSNDYLAALTKKNLNSNNVQEPKASLVLFYQYVSPPWTPGKVAALSTYITNIVKSHRENIGGRVRISTEGVNCTVSAASTHSNEDAELEAARTLRHFAEDLRNFDPVAFEETDFKYVDGLSADRHFKEMKILPVKELVFYGIREDEEEGAAIATTEETGASAMQVLPKNAKGGIHLEANEYHEMLKKNDAVVIDVRNHYEAAIGRFDGQIMLGQKKKGDQEDQSGNNGHDGEKSGAQYIDPKMRKSTDFTSWLDEPETKQKLEGKTVMMFCTGKDNNC
jgi:predicted sulfurtransferase